MANQVKLQQAGYPSLTNVALHRSDTPQQQPRLSRDAMFAQDLSP
jgi:hypothetical protein